MTMIRCAIKTLAATLFSTAAAFACDAMAQTPAQLQAQTPAQPIVLARHVAQPHNTAATAATVPAGTNFPARPSPVAAPAHAKAVSAVAGASAAPTPRPVTSKATHLTMDTDFASPSPDEKVLHLVLGHSLFIDTKHRLSRIYITNPDVLSSYTASPNQVVVTAKGAGLSTLIIWDEAGDTQVYMVSSETDVTALTGAIKKAFPMDDIAVSGSEGRITLTGTVGTQATATAVGKLAELYTKDVSNALFVSSSKIKQVRLKVRFAEVDRARISQFGFNLFAILNQNGSNPTLITSTTGAFPSTISTSGSTGSSSGGGSSQGVASQTVSVSNALNYVIYNASHNIGATIQDLEDKQIMHILAEPSITAMSGQKANFLAGGEFPFPVVQGGTAGTTAAVSIIFKPYGVKLDFTPIVNSDGTIDLTVAPEVSALDYSNAVSIGGYTIPALSTRRAQTQVVLRDGQSFAISGLLDQRTTDSLGRTPGIASVPILGALFRSKNINHSTSELVVIVTPEIVDPLTDHPIKEPTSPVPMLSPQKFDDALPMSVKKPSAAK